MGENFLSVFAVCLAVSALPLACGDDEDGDDGDGSNGGTAGSGNGGTAGSGNGGTAGSGNGGTSGTAGTTGTGGRGGTAGTGGTTGGTAGTAGIGGEGGMGGAEGGMGGEGGGPPEPTLCERACAAQASLDCANEADCPADNCQNFYEGATNRTRCDPVFDMIFECWANEPASSFICRSDGNADYTGADCMDEIDAAVDTDCFR